VGLVAAVYTGNTNQNKNKKNFRYTNNASSCFDNLQHYNIIWHICHYATLGRIKTNAT